MHKQNLCMCSDCEPNPSDEKTLVFQTMEKILNTLKIADANSHEISEVKNHLKKLLKDAKALSRAKKEKAKGDAVNV